MPKKTPELRPEDGSRYTEDGFWGKVRVIIKGCSYEIAKSVLEVALTLYYVLNSPNANSHAQHSIRSALFYLIMPFDAIPDAIPVIGYTDDLGVMKACLVVIVCLVDDEIKEKVAKTLNQFLGTKP